MDIIQVITSTDVIEVTGPDKIVEVATVGPQGPQGPAGASNLDGLTDVTITTPSSGQALVYNGSAWVNQAVSTVGALDDLTDVAIAMPASGNVLRYSGSQWVNGSVAYSELTGVPSTFPPSVHTHVAADVVDFSAAADARISAASIDALADVTVTTPAGGHVLRWSGSAWANAPLDASDVTSGTFANARISQSSVTQHQGALSVGWGQLTGVPGTFPPSPHTHTASEITDFSAAADARISAANLDALANVAVSSPSSGNVLQYNGTNWVNATVVTSVGLTAPAIFSVAGSPITGSGTLAITLQTQAKNQVFAGPASGSDAAPTFRTLTNEDLPVAIDVGHGGTGSSSFVTGEIPVFNGTALAGVGNKTLAYSTLSGLVVGRGTSAGAITLSEGRAGGSNTCTIQAAASIPANHVYTLPAFLPGSTLFVRVSNTGVVSFAAALTQTGGTSNGDIQFRNNVSTLGADAELRWDTVNGSLVIASKTDAFPVLSIFNAGATETLLEVDPSASELRTDTELVLKVVGKGIRIAEGSNARMGVATLSGGTVVVSTNKVTANSRIFLTAQSPGGTPGAVYVSARTAGTSFTITSTSGTDTSVVAWHIIEPS